MVICADIDIVIHQLQEFKKQGYTTVEVIDNDSRFWWNKEYPELTFVFNRNEPNVVGIAVPNAPIKPNWDSIPK